MLFETEDFTSVCSPTGVYTVHDVLAWVCMRAQCMASWRMPARCRYPGECVYNICVWLLLWMPFRLSFHSEMCVVVLLHKLALYTHPNLQLIESQCFLVTALHNT